MDSSADLFDEEGDEDVKYFMMDQDVEDSDDLGPSGIGNVDNNKNDGPISQNVTNIDEAKDMPLTSETSNKFPCTEQQTCANYEEGGSVSMAKRQMETQSQSKRFDTFRTACESKNMVKNKELLNHRSERCTENEMEGDNDVIIIGDDGELSDSELMNSVSSFDTSLNLEPDKSKRSQSTRSNTVDSNCPSASAHSSNTTDPDPHQTEADFVCPFCSIQESSLNDLECHLAASHAEFAVSPQGSSVNSVPGSDISHVTAERGSENPHDLDLNTSLMTDEMAAFTCPFCDVSLGDAVALLEHVNRLHENLSDSQGEMHSCPLCGFKCNFDHEMKDHVASHESDGTYFAVGTNSASDASSGSNSGSLACPMCGLLMSDPDLLTSHVETHFSPQHSPGPSSTQLSENSKLTTSSGNSKKQPRHKPTKSYSSDRENQPSSSYSSSSSEQISPSSDQEKGSYRQQHERGLERAFMRGKISVGEYHEQRAQLSRVGAKDLDDGQTRVPGLVEKIEELFRRQAQPHQQVFLCAPTDHFSGDYGDKGWGCGYRNFQMMLSCLLRHPEFSSRLSAGGYTSIPSIPKVQGMIEEAWRLGFDPQGRQQLAGKLTKTRKWIGATEIVATFSSLRIKCRLADFHFPSAPDGTHPRLMQWVSDYFCSDAPFKPPLYLQHQGHSRTIIGVEKLKEVPKLLLFDPGNSNMTALANSPLTWKQMRTFRRPQAAFQARQYQVVAIVGLLSEAEYQESKVLKSERVS